MGILSDNFDQLLGKFREKYMNVYATDYRLNTITDQELNKHYRMTSQIQDLMTIDDLCLKIRWKIAKMIIHILGDLTADEVLPSQIFRALEYRGIKCDAIAITAFAHPTRTVHAVKFALYSKKSGRERYAFVGYAGITVQDDPRKSEYDAHQEFWRSMLKYWQSANSVRISSILRKKKLSRLMATFPPNQWKIIHQYFIENVNS
ncbi:MAG: hypothetical protein HDS66_01105 [Bacteroidales bacterium]|nr:hypothetical protein [Bacteroidales bacterium]